MEKVKDTILKSARERVNYKATTIRLQLSSKQKHCRPEVSAGKT